MTDGHDHGYEAGVDREISLKSIAITGIVLALIVVASAALMWVMANQLRGGLEARDPDRPALQEAWIQEPPPDPRLQTSPEEDMRALTAEEEEALYGYGWVDQAGGVARVPIARAMEMLANQELPAVAPAARQGGEAAAQPTAEPAVEEDDG